MIENILEDLIKIYNFCSEISFYYDVHEMKQKHYKFCNNTCLIVCCNF